METIKAAEKALKDVFCDEYIFQIPPYQRPYSWNQDQAEDLLDDLIWAAGEGNPSERAPYFLGSIVVIKDPHDPKSDVVDGQQRLTTLTILFCALRDLAESDKIRNDIDIFIKQKGNSLINTKDQPRLSIRQRDSKFFRDFIQDGKPYNVDDPDITDSRRLMINNREYFYNAIRDMKQKERESLLSFCVQRCYIVIVEASDQSSAYRIFSVMNDRGLDLSATDILKSDIIGAIEGEAEQESYNAEWEALEDGLGREAFGDLFAHLRMIHRKQKMRGSLEQCPINLHRILRRRSSWRILSV